MKFFCLVGWLVFTHYFFLTSLMIDTELNSVIPIRNPLHRYYSHMPLEIHLHNHFLVRTVLNLTYSLLSVFPHSPAEWPSNFCCIAKIFLRTLIFISNFNIQFYCTCSCLQTKSLWQISEYIKYSGLTFRWVDTKYLFFQVSGIDSQICVRKTKSLSFPVIYCIRVYLLSTRT